MSTWVVIVAAGSGSRFGGAKQFEKLGGKRVLDWSIGTASAIADGVVVVVAPEVLDEVQATIQVDAVVAGGVTRSESVRAGLSQVPDNADIVVVHDAARPLASKELFRSVIAAVQSGADAAIPGVPIFDTIKRVESGSQSVVVETIDRSDLIAVQTPQAFKATALRSAHASRPEASDDALVVEAANGRVVAITGEANNIKITLSRDIATLETWLSQ